MNAIFLGEPGDSRRYSSQSLFAVVHDEVKNHFACQPVVEHSARNGQAKVEIATKRGKPQACDPVQSLPMESTIGEDANGFTDGTHGALLSGNLLYYNDITNLSRVEKREDFW